MHMHVKIIIMTIITGQMKIKPMLEWGSMLNFIPDTEVKRYSYNKNIVMCYKYHI